MTDLNKVVEAVERLTGKSGYMEVEEYYFSENYYDTNNTIMDDEYWFEYISFPEEAIEDAKKYLEDSYDKEVIEDEGSGRLARRELEEALSYWTVYFEPRIDDAVVALQCGLTPFEYQDIFYLALGGCGMDLSPRLDAYQALTYNTIPRSSKLLSDRKYFEYVVGKEVTERVIKAVTRDEKRVEISFALSEKSELKAV